MELQLILIIFYYAGGPYEAHCHHEPHRPPPRDQDSALQHRPGRQHTGAALPHLRVPQHKRERWDGVKKAKL